MISSLTREAGRWSFLLSGDDKRARPSAISGAAYVDFLALARADGLLGPMGRFEANHPEVEERDGPDGLQRLVTIHRKLFVSETDVAELIQAKAAIAAGVMTLLEVADLRPADLERFFNAGGFGYHLDRQHAIESLQSTAQVIELNQIESFDDHFIDCMRDPK